MIKLKNTILTGICCVVLIAILTGCSIPSSKIENLERTYLESGSEKDLVILCNGLLNTKEYSKKLTYYPKILDMKQKDFETICDPLPEEQQPRDFYGRTMFSNIAYNEIFAQYLFAPVMMGDFDLFRELFSDRWSFTDSNPIGATQFFEYMGNNKLPDEGYDVILSAFQENFPEDITNAPNDAMLWRKVVLNYQGQSFAYAYSGDMKNHDAIQKKCDEFEQWCNEERKQ